VPGDPSSTAVRYVSVVLTPARKQPDDEEMPELPPLDGADDEVEDPAPDLEDGELPADDAGDPLDDRAGDPAQGDGSAELDLAAEEGGWLEDADDAEGLDIGDAELLGEQTDLLEDNDESGATDEDEDLDDEDSGARAETDAGEEGPGDEDEELREEDLPRLDADEEGAPNDEDFIDEDFGDDEAALGIPWHTERWDRVGAPLAVGPVRALACVPRGVLAGGVGLHRLDLEGGVEKLAATGLDGGDVTGVWASALAVVVTTEDGGLFISRNQGDSFVRVAAWHALVRPDEIAAGVDVVLGSSELWLRTALGTLLWSGDLGASFDTVDLGGFVGAIGVDAGDLAAFVRNLRGGELAQGRRSSLVHTVLTWEPLTGDLVGRLRLATRGQNVALAPEGKALSISLDGGASWTRAPRTETATALAWSGGEYLVVGLYNERQERAFLARVSSRGESQLVAEIVGAPADAEGGILTLVCDEARGVVWVGGGFGVATFQPTGVAA
jgi:hypothetical protein